MKALLCQIDGHLDAAVAMLAVVGGDGDAVQGCGESNPAQATGEGLLVDMGMGEDAGRQNRSLAVADFPAVGVMVPAAIRVTQGDIEAIDAGGCLAYHHILDIDLAGADRAGDGADRRR